MGTRKDMTGKVIGRLTVLAATDSDMHGNSRWQCHCECGNEVVVLGFALRNGRTVSCGCYAEECRNKLMVQADLERRLYTKNSWKAMMGRCYNPKHPAFYKYGAKGVTVCEKWHKWLAFFEDMGPKPFGYSIDRIDGTKGYFPENCRWATQRQQLENRARRR